MSKACAFCIFIPGTYIIHYIHNRHWCGCIPVYNYPKTICKSKFFKQYHNTSRVFQNKFVKVIEKLRKVIENIQVEKCSECWYEFNGWVKAGSPFSLCSRKKIKTSENTFYFKLKLHQISLPADNHLNFFTGNLECLFILLKILGNVIINTDYDVSFHQPGKFGRRTNGNISQHYFPINKI